MISANSYQLSVILMNLDIIGEVGMQTGLIDRTQTQNEVALQILFVIEIGSRVYHKMELHSGHM